MRFGGVGDECVPRLGCFFPHFESRAKLHKAAGGMAGQMERKEYVYLINAGKREGAAAER